MSVSGAEDKGEQESGGKDTISLVPDNLGLVLQGAAGLEPRGEGGALASKGRRCWPFGRRSRGQASMGDREMELRERRKLILQEEATRRETEHKAMMKAIADLKGDGVQPPSPAARPSIPPVADRRCCVGVQSSGSIV